MTNLEFPVKVFCGAISHETNSFSPIPTGLASFERQLLFAPGELVSADKDAWPEPMQGLREKAAELGWDIHQSLCASAMPSGLCKRTDYEGLRDQLIEDLCATMPVDAVALCLHGAMMAQGYPDCEGDILAAVRDVVGPDIPVGAVLDPHAHLTDAMIDNATIMNFFKEYPHTDVVDSARDLIALLSRCLEGGVKPLVAVHDVRMISMFFTESEPMRSFVNRMRDAEQQPGILSVSLVHGFPWGDTSDMGTKMLVYTADRPALGERVAQQFGEELFSLRNQTMWELPAARTTVDTIPNDGDGPLVLADSADNPGGGAPGDCTSIIHTLLAHGVEDIAVGPFWDPMAVQTAFAFGQGAKVAMRVGGKASQFSGVPLDREFEIVALRRDAEQVVNDWAWPMGDTALLRSETLDIVVTTERLQAVNTDIFTCVGLDPAAKNVIVVKSAQHFVPGFRAIARDIQFVASDGALLSIGDPDRYQHLTRPKWPFDQIMDDGTEPLPARAANAR